MGDRPDMSVYIGAILGWKFEFIEETFSGIDTRNGVITKFPPNVLGVNYDSNGIPSQADQDKWTAEYLVEFPEGFDDWRASMQETDSGMPRYLEDLITDNPDFNIHEKMKTRYDEKVALRATKP
jgi:hypothetical protein